MTFLCVNIKINMIKSNPGTFSKQCGIRGPPLAVLALVDDVLHCRQQQTVCCHMKRDNFKNDRFSNQEPSCINILNNMLYTDVYCVYLILSLGILGVSCTVSPYHGLSGVLESL
jgi:hypothetical protein